MVEMSVGVNPNSFRPVCRELKASVVYQPVSTINHPFLTSIR